MITERDTDLAEVIRRLNIELLQAKEEIEAKDLQIKVLERKDSLTGAGNRHALVETFSELRNRSIRLNHPSTLAIIDINDFKKVNNELGFDEGDRLLSYMVESAVKKTRVGFDYVFRIGGDEFLILFTNCNEVQAGKVIERIDKAFCKETDIASLSYGAVAVDFKMVHSLEIHISKADDKLLEYKKEYKSNR